MKQQISTLRDEVATLREQVSVLRDEVVALRAERTTRTEGASARKVAVDAADDGADGAHAGGGGTIDIEPAGAESTANPLAEAGQADHSGVDTQKTISLMRGSIFQGRVDGQSH